MSSELLDYVARDNFEFFRMSSHAERGQKEELQGDCERVLHYAHATVKDMCLLAVQLCEMKDKGVWEHVINPKTGFGFYNDTFADFCDYAFGFSKTKTSDLLRISQFVNLHGEHRGEIEAGYEHYSTSKLVELASVPPSYRAYFNSDMSVAEMRVAKDYVKNSGEFLEEKKKVGFDLLTKAQEWKENGRTSAPVKPDVLPGQQSIFPEDNDDGAGVVNPTPDLAELGEEQEVSEEERESAIKAALTSDENQAVRIYKKYQENPLHSEFVDYIKHAYGLGGSYRNYLSLDYNHKGLTIRKDTKTFKEIFTVFLSWAQVAWRIEALINNDEYLNYTVKFSIDEQLKKESNQTDADEIEREYIPERDEYDELDEVQEDMRGEMEAIEAEAEKSVSETPRVDLSTNAKIREFLHGYENWGRRFCSYPLEFLSVYWYSFSNYKAILAVVSPCCADMEKMQNDHSTVRYYWKNELNGKFFEVTTRELERVLPLIKDEL